MKKLYEVKRGSLLELDLVINGNESKETVQFHHLDGAYSYCTIVGGKADGEVVHLSASTPLKVKVTDNGLRYIIE